MKPGPSNKSFETREWWCGRLLLVLKSGSHSNNPEKSFNPWLVLVFDHQGTCEQGGDNKHMKEDQSDPEQEWNWPSVLSFMSTKYRN